VRLLRDLRDKPGAGSAILSAKGGHPMHSGAGFIQKFTELIVAAFDWLKEFFFMLTDYPLYVGIAIALVVLLVVFIVVKKRARGE
jgi:hypothetical protein